MAFFTGTTPANGNVILLSKLTHSHTISHTEITRC